LLGRCIGRMSYREVSVIEIREILRLWLQGRGLREVARLSGTDRKTVRRYVDRARACGLDRDGDACQLSDELLAAVIGGVRPSRPNGKSQAWETIDGQREQIQAWLKQDLTLTKVHTLLGRRGVVVSHRTLHRYATTELGFGQRKATVRVAEGEPGAEVQVDFGRLGLLTDAEDGRRRVVQGLIFTAVLKPVPDEVFDIPTWTGPKVAPDRHVQVAKALYSVPGELIGRRLDARVDAHTVKLYWRGELIKVHPVMAPGRRHTDPADLPAEVSVYAMRDLNTLQRKASAHGTHVGAYAAAVLEHPLPWTKMRQVYRLLGLVRRHGPDAVEDACRRALDAEVIDVGLIDRMLSRGAGEQLPLIATPPAAASRFVRAGTDFAVRRRS